MLLSFHILHFRRIIQIMCHKNNDCSTTGVPDAVMVMFCLFVFAFYVFSSSFFALEHDVIDCEDKQSYIISVQHKLITALQLFYYSISSLPVAEEAQVAIQV